ncbi:MAG: leucine-rich repeat protein, partial [Oscillospiraceae bacterium]|nr:leucine-rich repeat protein [Oscillospiraceae bacterium]
EIGLGAFCECTSLTEISIPDSVTAIGDRAFLGCTSLTEISIPDSVTAINDLTFAGCTSLIKVTIPDSVTTIGYKAFWVCTSLTEISIPDSVTTIGREVFVNCTSLDLTISSTHIHTYIDTFDDIKALYFSEQLLEEGYCSLFLTDKRRKKFPVKNVYIGTERYNAQENPDHIIFKYGYGEKITSVSNYVKRISTFANARANNKRFFFRGESKKHELMIPSVMRESKNAEAEKKTEANERKEFYLGKKEREIFFDVISERPQEFSALSRPSDILSKMQHYGVPTRLLDITGNALMALFFACEKNDKDDGILNIFAPESGEIKNCYSDTVTMLSILPRLTFEEKKELAELANEHSAKKSFSDELYENSPALKHFITEIRKEQPAFSKDIKPNDLLNSVIYIPQKNNTHIDRQDGAFILYGLPIKTQKGDMRSEPDINAEREWEYGFRNLQPMWLTIPHGCKERIRKELDLMGINESTAYTDLSRTAAYVAKRYGM